MNIQEQVLPIKDRLTFLKDIFIQETAQKKKEECFLHIKPHKDQEDTVASADDPNCSLNETGVFPELCQFC
jgi:hypothetical protein